MVSLSETLLLAMSSTRLLLRVSPLSRSENKTEPMSFDSRLFEGYSGILKADKLTVDDVTYEILTQM